MGRRGGGEGGRKLFVVKRACSGKTECGRELVHFRLGAVDEGHSLDSSLVRVRFGHQAFTCHANARS